MISENSLGTPVELDRKDASAINAAARLRSCVDWVTLDASEVVLNPQQQKEVSIHIKIPQSARGVLLCGYYRLGKESRQRQICHRARFQIAGADINNGTRPDSQAENRRNRRCYAIPAANDKPFPPLLISS